MKSILSMYSSNETVKDTDNNCWSANIICTFGDTVIDADISRMKITVNKGSMNEIFGGQKTVENTTNTVHHANDSNLVSNLRPKIHIPWH